MLPNRIAVYLAAFVGLGTALAPIIADADWTSTAGIIAGGGIILGAIATWLRGWQLFEARNGIGIPEDLPPAGGDPDAPQL
jgi:protein-S-isoprenylcysteine O-methyltransferase Ste14